MGWRGRGWRGPGPGRGPFSYLPPWQRPGWLYGRGVCWWLLAPHPQTIIQQTPTVMTPPSLAMSKEQEIVMLQNQVELLEQMLEQIRKRLAELRSSGKE